MAPKIKTLDKVNLETEQAYLSTFIGERKIKSINRNDWTVWDGERSWACHPKTKVEIKEYSEILKEISS